MLHPLVTLWRHTCRVTFYESGGLLDKALFPGSADPGRNPVAGYRRRFRAVDEAQTYLRFWMGDPSARAELNWLLSRSGPSSANQRGAMNDWLQVLAGRLYAGAVVVMEESSRLAVPGRLVVASSSTEVAAAALSSMPPLAAVPAVPVVPPLLPALEEVQVEGAEVLPEIEQSLAQVDATLGTVGSASASLEPAPSKVGDINVAMNDAASKIQQQLGDL